MCYYFTFIQKYHSLLNVREEYNQICILHCFVCFPSTFAFCNISVEYFFRYKSKTVENESL